jgi:F0F1-type ATP synthase delta subunit
MKQLRTKISKVIADQTLAGGNAQQLSQEVAAYLLSERRVNELDSILRDIQADWAAAGHVEVIAASAHPLSAETKSEIERQVKQLYPAAKRIVVVETDDPAVIGGVRLNLANQQLDLSVEAKLNKFKQLTTAGKD